MNIPATQVQREREFHNQWANNIELDELMVKESFESPTAIENRYALQQFGPLKGKRLLDLGCGAGETSTYFALQEAEVDSCGIADNFLKLAESLAAKYQVAIHPAAASAGHLPYASESFDCVFGNGVLHHLDLNTSVHEIYRILKPGGKAIFIEPLPYNPVINIYRWMAKEVRTADEKPLTYRKIHDFAAHFTSYHQKEFWLLSLSMFLYFFFIKHWNPSKIRYWKKIIEVGEQYEKMFSRLQKADAILLRTFPFLKPLCWNTVIVTVK